MACMLNRSNTVGKIKELLEFIFLKNFILREIENNGASLYVVT